MTHKAALPRLVVLGIAFFIVFALTGALVLRVLHVGYEDLFGEDDSAVEYISGRRALSELSDAVQAQIKCFPALDNVNVECRVDGGWRGKKTVWLRCDFTQEQAKTLLRCIKPDQFVSASSLFGKSNKPLWWQPESELNLKVMFSFRPYPTYIAIPVQGGHLYILVVRT